MSSLLLKIQDTVSKYADIVSRIAQVDVEVVDNNLFRVAGTGIFRQKLNVDMSSEGHVYRQVLRTGKTQIIYEPRKEKLCQDCPACNECQEEIEISMPVRMSGNIIGIIGLVGSTKEQKDRILAQEKLYLDFLEQIAVFIAAKAQEYVSQTSKNALLGTLNCTLDFIDQGIMILGTDGIITTANEAARQQLKINLLEGTLAVLEATGDHLNNSNEYKLKIGEQEFRIMGQLHSLPNPTKRYAEVILFHNSMDVRKKYYEMTSTAQSLSTKNMIGSSPKTQKLKQEIQKVAQSSSTVLITGESGTGKEMVASAIWSASDRKNGKFIAINCAAIPEALLESELFGYVKGAFSGADPNGRMGKFELANKGVIFLDEIGDMPLYLQSKLLRVLQERKIVRIGSNQLLPIDVRVLAATNKNLKEMIKEKKFREDLYYRLNVIPLEIPPLRERKEDIEELAVHFAQRYAQLFGKKFWKFTEPVMEKLRNYSWDGNVRELENVTEFMVNMMGPEGILDEDTLPEELRRETISVINSEEEDAPKFADTLQWMESSSDADRPICTLQELERKEIRRALAKFGTTTEGKKRAAKELGIGLATLYRKMENMEH